MRSTLKYCLVLFLFVLLFAFSSLAQVLQGPTTIRNSVHHDLSLPLSVMAQNATPLKLTKREAEAWKRIPLPPGLSPLAVDPVIQTMSPLAASPAVGLSFEGLGQGQYGFSVMYAPPDTNGAVGSTQYVQWVNVSFAVFNKATGAKVLGPVAGKTLWSGFGGGCQNNNDGDPVVQYDKLANRWVMSQFSISTTPYLQCIAVSQTSDATGAWYRYSFSYSNNFDDYPKMGIWPDAYYETFDMFANGATWIGPDVCAYDRNKMLSGLAATQVCYQLGPSVGPLLPADVDGATPPPAGSPNYLMTYGTNALWLYKFHVDFTTLANSTFTGPTVISVAAFTPVCGGGTCIPQPGTTQTVDSLADRLMHRLAYRNFGTHESLVVSHSVVAGSSGGVRWYEIQNPNGTPVVAQQSTFAPDATYRWMPSVAMDQAGNLAVGYSKSSTSVFPSIAYAGRLATDPVSTLQTETTVVSGTGSQVGPPPPNAPLTRWGDYSAMTVDPIDDCTFWYTQEYLKAPSGNFNWNTRIANFKFPNCGSSVSISPTTLTFAAQLLGTASSTQSVTLTNSGTAAATGLSVAITGDFSVQTNTCPASLAGSSSCTISVKFTPTATGSRTGTLTVTDSAGTQTVGLSGTGSSGVSLSSGTVSFGNQGMGTTSAAKPVTLSNGSGVADASLTISITGTNPGDFKQTNTCGTSLAGSSSCTISVTFAPTAMGARSATLNVTGSAGTQTSSLSGTGTDVTPPSVNITAPANGATVSSNVTITAAATDNVGVKSILIYVDGALKATGAASPYSYVWNSTTVANGSHTIYATASDAAGNTGTSSTITVTVNNAVQQLFQNAGFETGNLTNWSAGGVYTPFVTSALKYDGKYSAQLGSSTTPEPNGDSWVYQSATVPSNAVGASLNFFYYGACANATDYQEVQIQNTSGATLAQVMKLCDNSKTWKKVYFNLMPYKGQTIRVYLNVHGSGSSSLTTYMNIDDVWFSVK
jgi:hypothetical protein